MSKRVRQGAWVVAARCGLPALSGAAHISYSGTPMSTAIVTNIPAPVIGYAQASAAPQARMARGARRWSAENPAAADPTHLRLRRKPRE